MKVNSLKKHMKNMTIYSWILILLLVLLCISVYRSAVIKIEGMTQKERFVSKKGEAIYDTFYSGIYDDLFFKKFSTQYEIGTIINETSPTQESKILVFCKRFNTFY